MDRLKLYNPHLSVGLSSNSHIADPYHTETSVIDCLTRDTVAQELAVALFGMDSDPNETVSLHGPTADKLPRVSNS